MQMVDGILSSLGRVKMGHGRARLAHQDFYLRKERRWTKSSLRNNWQADQLADKHSYSNPERSLLTR